LCSLTVRRKFSPEIREATLTDLDEIYKIEVECFAGNAFTYSHLEYCLRSPSFVKLVASVNGEVAGFIIGSLEDSRERIVGHVYTLDVKRKFRRMGIGSTLLEALEKIFINRGVEKCRLEVRLDNTAAIWIRCFRIGKRILDFALYDAACHKSPLMRIVFISKGER